MLSESLKRLSIATIFIEANKALMDWIGSHPGKKLGNYERGRELTVECFNAFSSF